MSQQYSSALLERAVDEFSKLPGVGRKTAMRLVLHMLRLDVGKIDAFTDAVSTLCHEVHYCSVCHNISDEDVCQICASSARDRSIICVVENVQDVMAIEQTMQYHGLYHVLGGVISPIDGGARSTGDRESCGACGQRRCGRGDICLEFNHGGRCHQFLHFP